jgi:hypothetical protein
VTIAVIVGGALLIAGCEEPRREELRPPPPGSICDAEHVGEERVTKMCTGGPGASGCSNSFETCLPMRRADGTIYAHNWGAWRKP